MAKTTHLFILGAGFSFNAGLPLASDFTTALLNVRGYRRSGPSRLMVDYLRDFVDETFGNGAIIKPADWPVLEDIFTLVDLSANSGHHLGPEYSAAALRTIRRALIVRLIRMLRQRYQKRNRNHNKDWRNLERFLKLLNLENTAVLSLNWDTVVEQGLLDTRNVQNIDYGCGARAAKFTSDEFTLTNTGISKNYQLLKPHGSINWLYCDACREIYWLPANQSEKVAQVLFRERDWKTVGDGKHKVKTLSPPCPNCGSDALGTRLATFSYRKALDFPMHEATWSRAEDLLRSADTWIFFGYSMPAADYEFKHLLKRVELSRKKKPHVVLLTGGSRAKSTRVAYENFFGSNKNAERTYHCKGLTSAAIAELIELGALLPHPVSMA